MATTTEHPYRGVFRTADGGHLGLDFFATSRAFAQDHAQYFTRDRATQREVGPLTVVRVTRLASIDYAKAGSFYPVTPRGGSREPHYHIRWQNPAIVTHVHPSRKRHVHEGLVEYTTSPTAAESLLADVKATKAAYWTKRPAAKAGTP